MRGNQCSLYTRRRQSRPGLAAGQAPLLTLLKVRIGRVPGTDENRRPACAKPTEHLVRVHGASGRERGGRPRTHPSPPPTSRWPVSPPQRVRNGLSTPQAPAARSLHRRVTEWDLWLRPEAALSAPALASRRMVGGRRRRRVASGITRWVRGAVRIALPRWRSTGARSRSVHRLRLSGRCSRTSSAIPSGSHRCRRSAASYDPAPPSH